MAGNRDVQVCTENTGRVRVQYHILKQIAGMKGLMIVGGASTSKQESACARFMCGCVMVEVDRQYTSKVLMVDIAGSDVDERLHQSYSVYE